MRNLIQSLLVALTVFAPLGWLLLILGSGGASFDTLREVFPERTAATILFPVVGFIGFSGLAIVALWLSVFLDAPSLSLRLRRWILIGLSVGLLLDIWIVTQVAMDASTVIEHGLVFGLVWILGGPLVVGIWNIFRFFRSCEKGPNQPPQRNASTGPVSNFQSPARRG